MNGVRSQAFERAKTASCVSSARNPLEDATMALDRRATIKAGAMLALLSSASNRLLARAGHSSGQTPTPVPIVSLDGAASKNPPTLILASNRTYPPALQVWLDETLAPDDVLRVQASTTAAFKSLVFDDSIALDSAALSSSTLHLPGLSSVRPPAELYFRAKLGESGWSRIVKHGDQTPPTITSATSASVDEGAVSPSRVLTANEEISNWLIVGGADAALFTLNGATWTLHATTSYAEQNQYTVRFKAVDHANNASTQDFSLSINPRPGTRSLLSTVYKDRFIDLSSGQLTATSQLQNVGALGRVRSTYPRGGRLYVEFTVGEQSRNLAHAIGVCSPSLDIAGGAATAGKTAVITNDGFTLDATGTGRGPTPLSFGAGAQMALAINTETHKMWVAKNGTWSGDPVAGTGGIDIPLDGAVCVLVGLMVNQVARNSIAVNFGATPFIHPIPKGFSGFG